VMRRIEVRDDEDFHPRAKLEHGPGDGRIICERTNGKGLRPI
jgi:hypothetical protein